ncbi:hypothetical protein HBI25_170730 [Parastagonospora nodorum]|nr:hypothetical protein HBH50_089990 [Parastagonospora nodorum]KAH4092873.1 hypothetical protein HBH48_073410 [Parastagonospora nodorum]KAH4206791.1 hypothetical protein HBI95_120570 [Parastagonospora nodorum]KAH4413648.1 hypothetical protein HBH92_095950 [Parastagonospora nodorum]KAH4417345.1 hypothetical protein HBH93_208450 [Parastagonospora nodorum]
MGQGQSQQAEAPMSEWDSSISPEERAQAQADLRAKQQAALDKRIVSKNKKASTTAGTVGQIAKEPKMSEHALEKGEAPVTIDLVFHVESELESRSERELTPEEQAQAQMDLRAKQQAALDKRFVAQQKKGTATGMINAQAKKKPTALEQASKENVGFRNMDAQVEFRSWN